MFIAYFGCSLSLTLDVFPLGDDGEDGLGAALVPEVVVPAIEYGIN